MYINTPTMYYINIVRVIHCMKLQFVSDLHIEQYNKDFIITPIARNLALIGDICKAYHPKMYRFLDTISSEFERVLFIPGNHEYYENEIEPTEDYMKELCEDLDIEYLQMKTTQIDDVIITGCTLWSEPTPSGFHKTNDKNWIKDFTRERMTLEHKKHLDFLTNEIERNRENPHIILTHYAPIYEMNGRFMGDENTSMFSSELYHLFKPPIRYWLCGHVHQNITHVYNNIPCISNCFGNPDEINLKESFSFEKYVECNKK